MTKCCEARLRAGEVPVGSVVGIELDDEEYVVWRGESGGLCAMPRRCPHLDWDLTEASVEGDELVCPGHGWVFDLTGHAFKENMFGRKDPKDDVEVLTVVETDDEVRIVRPAS
jgi:nitrite reductase/ring-hydroxylating ferredoxin subunit